MSDEKASKFGVLKGLQQSSKPVNRPPESVHEPAAVLAVEPIPIPEVRFTNYLDADVSRRLQIYVAQLKSRKVQGGERVSIKSVLHQALVEFLDRNNG